jgi:serine protease AprX
MAGIDVLLEFPANISNPFELNMAAAESEMQSRSQAISYLDKFGGIGIELQDAAPPVPMFDIAIEDMTSERFSNEMAAAADSVDRMPDIQAGSVVISAEVSHARMAELIESPQVVVWPNSPLTLFQDTEFEGAFPLSGGGVDCRPFRAGVPMSEIQQRLGVDLLWSNGFRGQNIIVGIIDEGVNGGIYPVIGGHSRPQASLQPGQAAITSHGSMCAADVLLAAPAARIYDYPFLGVPNSGGALEMFQAVLLQRAIDGTPHLTNNSYGFVGVPPKTEAPNHEVHNLNHPVHRKVREVVNAGVACFFAAGNCGRECPSGVCHPSGIGPGRSIHGSNSLEEVITVVAVNSQHERIGYSSQGPGMFHGAKPDIASYSHFFGNFGLGRPGGSASPFDSGTSAATPVAAGVAAALLSAKPSLTPSALKQLLMKTATDIGPTVGWDRDHGTGVINLAAAYNQM